MSLEKLQLIAMASSAPHFKARWLEFWNSSVHSQQAVHFLPKGFNDKDLESWLNKASFGVGVSNQSPYISQIWNSLSTIIGHDIWHLQFVFDGHWCISFYIQVCQWVSCFLSISLLTLKDFTMWLMSSMLQLEKGVVDLFSEIIKEDSLTIDMEVAEKPKTINVYVQAKHN